MSYTCDNYQSRALEIANRAIDFAFIKPENKASSPEKDHFGGGDLHLSLIKSRNTPARIIEKNTEKRSHTQHLGSEYTLDILAWLRGKELVGNRCRRQSPQLGRRRHLVEWSCEVQQKLGLSKPTLHLAVKIVDLFMDGHDIQDPQLYLVCLGALLLASKMEERDGNIPRYSQMNLFVKNYFPLSDFLNLEFVMLGFFNWNLCLPTACCTANLLLPHSLLSTDLHNGGPLIHFEKGASYLEEYVQYFLKASLLDSAFMDISPSLVGSAIVAAARTAFGIRPTWPSKLIGMTGYTEIELRKPIMMLLAHHQCSGGEDLQMNYMTQNRGADEGYQSMNSSPATPRFR